MEVSSTCLSVFDAYIKLFSMPVEHADTALPPELIHASWSTDGYF